MALGAVSFFFLSQTLLFAGDTQLLPQLEKEMVSLVNKGQKVSVSVIAQSKIEPSQQTLSKSSNSQNSSRMIISKTIGSGFIYSRNGYIVTKNSIVAGADQIHVLLFNGDSLNAELIAVDPEIDLAILRVNKRDLPAPEFAPPEDLHVGSWVIVMGKSIGFSTAISFGMIQGVSQEGFLRVGVQVSPGIIGAPIFNFKGQIVGLLFAKVLANESDYAAYSLDDHFREGLALPIAQVRKRINRLIAMSQKRRGWLGITVSNKPGTSSIDTLVITHVFPNSPAYLAGIQAGDYILEFNGNRVHNLRDLLNQINAHNPRSRVSFTLLRNGKKFSRMVVLGERPPLTKIQKIVKRNFSIQSPGKSRAKNYRPVQSQRNMLLRIQRLEREVRFLQKQIKKN
ncbi:MAG: serine protease [Calditrichaeota bacterium]|nr:serine protease [Calditrichota bacterium]